MNIRCKYTFFSKLLRIHPKIKFTMKKILKAATMAALIFTGAVATAMAVGTTDSNCGCETCKCETCACSEKSCCADETVCCTETTASCSE